MKNPFLENQKKMIEAWTENMSKIPGMKEYAEAYQKMAEQPAEFWEKASESTIDPMQFWQTMASMPNFAQATNMFTMPGMEQWTEMFKSAGSPMDQWSEALKFSAAPMQQWATMMQSIADPSQYWKNMTKTIPGMNVYYDVMKMWQDIQNPEKFVSNFADTYNSLMQTALSNFMPAGVGPFMAQPKELMDSLVALYQYLFGPWMKIDEEILQRIAAGDASAYVAFFREFQERYEDTFQKIFNMSGMGLNREANEDYMRLFDTFFQAMYATGELIALIYNTVQDSARDLVAAYQTMVAEGKSVTTFKDFYDLWFKSTETALEDLFDTDEFAITFGKFADVYAQYMIANNKVVERMLKPLPIPTKTDMDSLYRTVYELRKEVRDLKREIKDLKAQADKKPQRPAGKK